MCAHHVYDAALSCNTVRNVTLGLGLVGNPCNNKTYISKHMATSQKTQGLWT